MKRLKLRNWVKVVLIIILTGVVVNHFNYVNDSYNKCMEKNHNVNMCSSLKN